MDNKTKALYVRVLDPEARSRKSKYVSLYTELLRGLPLAEKLDFTDMVAKITFK